MRYSLKLLAATVFLVSSPVEAVVIPILYEAALNHPQPRRLGLPKQSPP